MPQFLQGLKEQSQFLGNKLEKLLAAVQGIKQDTKISVDMSETSQKVDILRGELSARLVALKSSLETGNADTKQVLIALIPVLEAVRAAIEEKELRVEVPDTSKYLADLLEAIKKQTETIKKLPQPKEDRKIYQILGEIKKAIAEIRLEEKDIDFSGVEEKLNQLIVETKVKKTDKVEAMLGRILEKLGALSLRAPDTVKIDEMQFRELATRGASLGGAIMNSGEYYTTIWDGRRTVTTAGTAVRLDTTAIKCSKVEITALINNVDVVVVGSSTVVAAEATRRGTPLMQGDSVTLYVNDLSKIYIDAVNSGDGVSYSYFD